MVLESCWPAVRSQRAQVVDGSGEGEELSRKWMGSGVGDCEYRDLQEKFGTFL